MIFVYGNGQFEEGDKKLRGEIVLSEHKLYLRTPEGDLASTYVPLEKIFELRQKGPELAVFVRPTLTFQYAALIKGDQRKIKELVRDIARHRGFKKRFWKNEWYEEPF